MATYDNKIWLLKTIRDAFIETDDTGMCEAIMAGEDFCKIFQDKALEDKKRIREGRLSRPGTSRDTEILSDISEDEWDKEIVTQFDPYPGMGDSEDEDVGSYMQYEAFGGHRQRSNTAQWLEKKEQALKRAANMKVIKWEDSPIVTTEESKDIFVKEEIQKPEKQISLLAEQLKNCPNLPHRQYLEYAKFDGTGQMGLPTKKFKIFMTMLPEQLQNYPIVVCVIAEAKIKDLIGLTCYKCSIEHPEVSLGSVNQYGLCIAEDDGEVDWGFPCLDADEPCSKFGFTCLGLIELSTVSPSSTSPIPEDSRFVFFKEDIIGLSQSKGRQYTGGSDTSETVINAVKAHNEDKYKCTMHDAGKVIIAAEAPQSKTYRVQLLRKVRTNSAVNLLVTLDRIEIEPLVPSKHAFWSRPKYSIHNIDAIAWCQILEDRGRRTVFRLVYSPAHNHSVYGERSDTGTSNLSHPTSMYKIHDFECETEIAREIVEKINTILDLRNSPCRREYKTAKEKKVQTRRSFNIKHLN